MESNVIGECEHGVRGCIHIGKEHDEDCCFNGMWQHKYVCQECGHTMDSTKWFRNMRRDGTYEAPPFRPKDCAKCGSEKSMT